SSRRWAAAICSSSCTCGSRRCSRAATTGAPTHTRSSGRSRAPRRPNATPLAGRRRADVRAPLLLRRPAVSGLTSPMPAFSTVSVPPGDPIRSAGGRLQVPDRPIIPFIEGDGTGPDIWRASQAVFDAAVQKAFGGRRRIAWMEVHAGAKAFNRFNDWLPEETVTAFKEFVVGIKGPLTTPVGG